MWDYIILGLIVFLIILIIYGVYKLIYYYFSESDNELVIKNTLCPTGTSVSNNGIEVNANGCRCIQGYTWDGKTCNCPIGMSMQNYGVSTNIDGCNCPQGYTWNGTICTDI